MRKIAALILAGTRAEGDGLAEAHGVSHKSLIEIGDQPMLTRVVAALRAAGIKRIVVSTNDARVRHLAIGQGCEAMAAEPGPSKSVAAAIEIIGTPTIITTSDHALLDADMVHDFLDSAPEDADVAILMAHRDRVQSAMPGSARTYLSFADGDWSGCNLFLLRTERAQAAVGLWQMVEADRKQPWRIAAKLGLSTLVMMLFKRLDLQEAISRLGLRAGIKAAMVPANNGLAAVDVDKESDLKAVRQKIET
ncbi:GTP--adenosylcobinamide-phosphate guanylyltransferase [Erythrobacter litoralis]|uniref:nucleotidyltransferase family protein n=1 Tax=Erythrobacter litoralis TaxID=39960 RepID=UPI002435233D|nr:nucleotidyltransferase family protein [Erythrobacter litoralis]MDG6078268.1 GTP--adenosylcobinamide-phosphate guanylyltransferase [Erythrobacter litoralis]